MACGLWGRVQCVRPVSLQVLQNHLMENEEGLHLHSRCFFLGAITSWVVALQTARAISDPVSWYCAAAMRSVSVCPDIFSALNRPLQECILPRDNVKKNVTETQLLPGGGSVSRSRAFLFPDWQACDLLCGRKKRTMWAQTSRISAIFASNRAVTLIICAVTWVDLRKVVNSQWLVPYRLRAFSSAPWTAKATRLCNTQLAMKAISSPRSNYLKKIGRWKKLRKRGCPDRSKIIYFSKKKWRM